MDNIQDPSGLTATAFSKVNRIEFAGNNDANVSYEVWRRAGDEGEWGVLDVVTGNTFEDEGVKPGQYYEYRVRAQAGESVSNYSTSAVVYGVE